MGLSASSLAAMMMPKKDMCGALEQDQLFVRKQYEYAWQSEVLEC